MPTNPEYLLDIDIYDGEKVSHHTWCVIHFHIYAESGEFPWELCQNTSIVGTHKREMKCAMCTEENEVEAKYPNDHTQVCLVCGGEGEHNWEVHVAEMRYG